MKKIFAVLFCTLIIVGCKQGGSVDCGDPRVTCSRSPININTYEIDPVATAAAPWKIGDVVFEWEYVYFETYRKFFGVTVEGYYLVQEFYKGGNVKASDPYILMKEEDVNKDVRLRTSAHGVLVSRYKNGQKWSEHHYKNGKLFGISRKWDEKGNLIEERNYGAAKD